MRSRIDFECVDAVGAVPVILVVLWRSDPYAPGVNVPGYAVREYACCEQDGRVICIRGEGERESHPARKVYVKEYRCMREVLDEVAGEVQEWVKSEERFASVTAAGLSGGDVEYLASRLGVKAECAFVG